MTQRSAPVMSVICPQVRSIKPQKIEPCWVISKAAKVSPRTMPRNFALSPTSILIAIQHNAPPPLQSAASAPSGTVSPASSSGGTQPRAARQNDVIWSVR